MNRGLQKLRQLGYRSCRNDRHGHGRTIFFNGTLLDRDARGDAKVLGTISQEFDPARARLDEHHRTVDKQRHDEAGHSCAGPDVQPGAPAGAFSQIDQLRRIDEMAPPERVERGCGNQILALRFDAKPRRERFERCFTWNAEALDDPFMGFVFGHAARRAWRRIADNAAGVIPRMRAAAPSVRGRAALRRSTISLESPRTSAKSRS